MVRSSTALPVESNTFGRDEILHAVSGYAKRESQLSRLILELMNADNPYALERVKSLDVP